MIKPIEDKIVIQPIRDTEKVTSSGLIVAGNDTSSTELGTVLAVGTGIILQNGTHIPLNVNVGDTVMYSPFSGLEVEHKSEKVLILSYREILAIIEDENE